MILINKELDENRMIVTISENVTDDSQGFNMLINSPVTLQTFTINLPANTSLHKNRYDEFLLDSSIFNEMKEGQYFYFIFQKADNKLLEAGLLEIVGNDDEVEFISLPQQETEDDFVIYTPE